MDGRFAVLFAVFGLFDTYETQCPQCFAIQPAQPKAVLSFGVTARNYRLNSFGKRKSPYDAFELDFAYAFDRKYGVFQPAIAFSISDRQSAWIGSGFLYNKPITTDHKWFYEFSFIPGLYARGKGPDLGHTIEFLSGFAIGYKINDKKSISLSFDHRSHGGLVHYNPGLESIAIQYTWFLDNNTCAIKRAC